MKKHLLFFALLVGVLAAPLLGFAVTLTVSTTADDGSAGSLRKTILAAEGAGTSTIIVPAGTYILTMGGIEFGDVAETITINGAGAGSTIIQMASNAFKDRILLVNLSGTVTNVNVSISGITFENGFLTADNNGGGAILCGGPTNTIQLTNCIFSGNTAPTAQASNGGAVAMEGGGSLVITGCTFSNNADAAGNGGAIFYSEPGNQSGALTITNTLFAGNSCSVSPTGGQGGAILISETGNSGGFTSTMSITQCTFIGNTASGGTGSLGGAISIDNAFAAGNTDFINYNRFNGNKAAAIPDVVVGNAQGNVDLSNNWWGSNLSPTSATDPHVLLQGSGGGGTLTSSPWLELTVSKTSPTLCAGSGASTVATAGFTKNSSGGAVAVANLGAFIGLPVSFSATLGATASVQTTIQSTGMATATVEPTAASGTMDVQAVVDSVSVTDAVAQATYTLTAPSSLPSSSSSGTIVIGGSEPVTDGSCNEILSVVATGASPISGSVLASETIDPSVQSVNGQAYVQRHYDITPAVGASTATATITLYFLQSEFNAYNAVVGNPALALPTTSTDAVGKGNLTITQYHGSGTAPGNYSGWTGSGPASVLISPGSSNVVWNNAKNWWEVSFPVTGFSGFYVTGPLSVPLPVVLEHFGGMMQGTGVMLDWQVGVESGLARYEVDGSGDGVTFTPLGDVTATGAGSYHYFVSNLVTGNNYYRLKMVNVDGTFTYSTIVVIDVTDAGRGVVVLSNPFTSSCTVRVTAAGGGMVNLRLTDLSGKVLWVSPVSLIAGVNTFTLPRTEALAKGVYLLSVIGGQLRETVKVVKE